MMFRSSIGRPRNEQGPGVSAMLGLLWTRLLGFWSLESCEN